MLRHTVAVPAATRPGPVADRQALSANQAVVLLDGLDEVQVNRAHLVRLVQAFVAEHERRDLLRYNVSVWLDQDEIRPGDFFARALEQGLNHSRRPAGPELTRRFVWESGLLDLEEEEAVKGGGLEHLSRDAGVAASRAQLHGHTFPDLLTVGRHVSGTFKVFV